MPLESLIFTVMWLFSNAETLLGPQLLVLPDSNSIVRAQYICYIILHYIIYYHYIVLNIIYYYYIQYIAYYTYYIINHYIIMITYYILINILYYIRKLGISIFMLLFNPVLIRIQQGSLWVRVVKGCQLPVIK